MQLISATSPLIPCWHPFNRSLTAAPPHQGPAAPRMLCPPAQTLHFQNLPWTLAVLLLFFCRQEDPQLCLLAAGQPGGPSMSG